MNDCVTISLTRDEALVLYEFMSRFFDEDEDTLIIRHNAEFIALSRVSEQLDKSVSVMFDPSYPVLLKAAQDRIADGYELRVYRHRFERHQGPAAGTAAERKLLFVQRLEAGTVTEHAGSGDVHHPAVAQNPRAFHLFQ